VCARGTNRALVCGPSTSPLASTEMLQSLRRITLLVTSLAGAVNSANTVAAPLTLSLAEKAVSSGPNAHFHVLWRNISDRPLRIWAESSSWGYECLSFEITDATGKHWRALKRRTVSTRNTPVYLTIAPGQTLVKTVFFGDTKTWEGFPVENDQPFSVRMHAVFKVAMSPEAAQIAVWTGRLESSEIVVTFTR
jgi:hypothetical protein